MQQRFIDLIGFGAYFAIVFGIAAYNVRRQSYTRAIERNAAARKLRDLSPVNGEEL